MRQGQRDRLRVLGAQRLGRLSGIEIAQEIKGPLPFAHRHPAEQLVGPLSPQRQPQNLADEVAILDQKRLVDQILVQLGQEDLALGGREPLQLDQLPREDAQLGLTEVP